MRDGRRGKKIHLISPYSLKGRSSPLSPIFFHKSRKNGSSRFSNFLDGGRRRRRGLSNAGGNEKGSGVKGEKRKSALCENISLSHSFLLLFFFQRLFRGGFSTLLAPSSSSSSRPNFRQFPSLLLSQEKKKRRPFPPSYSSSFVRGFSSPSPVSPQVESYRKTGEKHISPRLYR